MYLCSADLRLVPIFYWHLDRLRDFRGRRHIISAWYYSTQSSPLKKIIDVSRSLRPSREAKEERRTDKWLPSLLARRYQHTDISIWLYRQSVAGGQGDRDPVTGDCLAPTRHCYQLIDHASPLYLARYFALQMRALDKPLIQESSWYRTGHSRLCPNKRCPYQRYYGADIRAANDLRGTINGTRITVSEDTLYEHRLRSCLHVCLCDERVMNFIILMLIELMHCAKSLNQSQNKVAYLGDSFSIKYLLVVMTD